MYGGLDTQEIRRKGVHDYASALAHYESVKPVRGREVRPLANRKHLHKAIHKLADGSIACQYWSTDVVTYHPDGSVTVRPWSSKTTDEFFSAVAPEGMAASFNSKIGSILWTLDPAMLHLGWCNDSRRGYACPDAMTLVKDETGWWMPTRTPEPWSFRKVNAKRANAALKATRFREFEDFVTAWVALQGARWEPEAKYRSIRRRDALPLVNTQDQWVDHARRHGVTRIDRIRRAITYELGAWDVVELPHLTGWRDVDRVRRAERAVPGA